MENELKEGDIPLFDLDDKDLIRFAHRTKNQFISDIVAPEMMRRMKISIEEFNKNSSKQSKRIFWLTVAMGIVALLQLILLIQQI
jgi:hypothetical protein